MDGAAASCRDRLARLPPHRQVVAFVAFAQELSQQARGDFADGLGGFEGARRCNEAVEQLLSQVLRIESGRDWGSSLFAESVCETASSLGWMPMLHRSLALAERGGRPSRPSAPTSAWRAASQPS